MYCTAGDFLQNFAELPFTALEEVLIFAPSSRGDHTHIDQPSISRFIFLWRLIYPRKTQNFALCENFPLYGPVCSLAVLIYRELYRSKKSFPFQVFGNMDELLRKAPMVYSTASRSRSELHRHWQEWRSECIRWRDSADFIGIPWLQKIVMVSQSNNIDSLQVW